MPVISGSAVSAITTAPDTGFTPSGLFVVRVLVGQANLQCQLPGTTEWLDVAEVQGWRSAPVIHNAGTATEVTPAIPGTQYRFEPIFGDSSRPLTADAWSA